MKYVLLIALLLFGGCAQDPISRARTDNPDVPVGLLFTYDGCKIYRFSDGGQLRYFAKCDQSARVEYSDSYYDPVTKTVQEHRSSIETVYAP